MLFGTVQGGKRRARHAAYVSIEGLEDRTLLAAFVVDSLLDLADVNPGNGIAEDSNGNTTLRAAIDEANALAGPDTITIPIGGTITRTGAMIVITDDVEITGLGADMLTYDAALSGAAFRIFSSVVEISGMTIIRGNADAIGGGGIGVFGGDVTLRGLHIRDNAAVSGGGGGGVSLGADFTMGGAQGTLTILDSTISNNNSSSGGGIGIGNSGGDLFIANTTISNNIATADGAGIYFYQNDNTLEIHNSTIVGNHIESDAVTIQIGGGIYVEEFPTGGDPLPLLFNTIVAGNTTGVTTPVPNDIDGLNTTVDELDPRSAFNLIGAAGKAGGLIDGNLGNIVGINGSGTRPVADILNPTLSDNGGPTPTHALISTSPAIDTGSNFHGTNDMSVPLGLDQRGTGFPRLLGLRIDIGAYEGTGSGAFTANDVFGWDAADGRFKVGLSSGTAFSNTDGFAISPSAGWDFHSGDFNGDGLTDIAGRQANGQWWVELADGSGGYTLGFWLSWASNVSAGWTAVQVADLNRDGLDDVIGRDSSGQWWAGLSNGSSFDSEYFGKWAPMGWVDTLVADVNGDGMSDMAGLRDNGDWWFGLSTGDQFNLSYGGKWSGTAGWQNFAIGDFNGDGQDDVLAQAANGQWWGAVVNDLIKVSTFYVTTWSTTAGFSGAVLGDYDGDGRDDLAGRTGTNQWWVSLSNGAASMDPPAYWGAWSSTFTWTPRVGDFNGDGRDDIAGYNSAGNWYTLISSGSMFFNTFFGAWTGFTTVGYLDSGDLN